MSGLEPLVFWMPSFTIFAPAWNRWAATCGFVSLLSREIISAILSPTTLELEANPAKLKILCQTCGRLAKHGVIATASRPTPKPCVTRWNSKESPHKLPEEKCPSVVLEICALFTFFKLRCLEKDTPASITSRRGFHSIWFSAQEAAWTKGQFRSVASPHDQTG